MNPPPSLGERDRSFDVAVVGLSGRFPGAASLGDWWTALIEGRVLTQRYDRQELLEVGVPPSLVDDPDYVPISGHLAEATRFDNTLFRVSPREAELMDPQHRLMLEAVWTALEDAGTAPLGGLPRTAVFASMTGSAYMRTIVAGNDLDSATLDDLIHGNEPDFVASRIAYKLGLEGPAFAVQTACSSSLVAVHIATQSLLHGDCDQAVVVAAGMGYPQAGHLCLPGGIHSPSGECRPFDVSADGVVGGAGVVCVILRRVADGLADAVDPYGVILGTAINNDGGSKAGYYAPSVSGQEAVIASAISAADVDAKSIGYLETHGTGTNVGDPIEWEAASAVLRRLGAQPRQIAIGALKANVGHLDAASGLAGLVKALFVVKTGLVPPVAGFTQYNPLLDAKDSPLYVPTATARWPGTCPRRAGVSSFGVGGTNAHVIIEQPPINSSIPRAKPAQPRLVLVSAADQPTLARAALNLASHLRRTEADLDNVSFTLAAGRAQLSERLAVVGADSTTVAARLASAPVGRDGAADRPPPLVFLFPGQGSQYPGMATAYAAGLPGFSAALENCLAAFDAALEARLRAALLDPAFDAAELDQTSLAQPALFAVSHAAAAALTALGARATAVVGHSLGEITAACFAGAIELAESIGLVASRGAAMQACPPGGMLAVGYDEEKSQRLGSEFGVELAAVNGPDSCVLSGTVGAIDLLEAHLPAEVFSRRLRTSRAFHSALIDPAIATLLTVLKGIPPRRTTLPMGLNITGDLLPVKTLFDPLQFAQQARRTVRFGDALAAIAARFPDAVVVEIGPGRPLSPAVEAHGLAAVPLSAGRRDDTPEGILAALGALWTVGVPVAPTRICASGRRIHLPTYPFEGTHWIAPEARSNRRRGDAPKRITRPEAVPEPAPVTDVSDARQVVETAWADVLGYSDLAEDADFFDLGGDSLAVTRLARAVNDGLGVRVPIRELLVRRTLGRQIEIIEKLVLASPANLLREKPSIATSVKED